MLDKHLEEPKLERVNRNTIFRVNRIPFFWKLLYGIKNSTGAEMKKRKMYKQIQTFKRRMLK